MVVAPATTVTLPPALSNATDSGDPWINNQIPNLPYQTVATPSYALNNGFSGLISPDITPGQAGIEYGTSGGAPLAPFPATGVLPMVWWLNSSLTNILPTTQTNLTSLPKNTYLGSGGGGTNTDDRQHPYWRSELMQKAMNLTTVRTHQYAVWITIGFFEVLKQGDLGMLVSTTPQLAFDTIGVEVGSVTGQNQRFRGFFLVGPAGSSRASIPPTSAASARPSSTARSSSNRPASARRQP